MVEDTVTLELDGDVPLAEFSQTIQHFSALLGALGDEIAGGNQIEWIVEELQAGSATATVRGSSLSPDTIPKIVLAYASVGNALETGQSIPYSEKVARHAHAITNVLDGKITAIRFRTATSQATIASTFAGERSLQYALGRVKGVIHTVSDRRRLRFTLYDALFDRAITCYITEDQEGLIRSAWRKRVAVSGRVGRDRERGRPVEVRDVTSVEIIDIPEPDSYKDIRGILKPALGSENPEDAIRRMRDAWADKLSILG